MLKISLCLWITLGASLAHAASATVAVAANFTAAAKEIGERFQASSGHSLLFSFGATGQLFTQISQGAPFDVFLAADQKRPQLAEQAGLAVPKSRFTYAYGKLVLFSMDSSLVKDASSLRHSHFTKLALANPRTAPYGSAAIAVLHALGEYQSLEKQIVQGNNIAQTYQFVVSRNAELGFVAQSQVINSNQGSRWIVPQSLYPRIAQDAVLLKTAAHNAAAIAFMQFLQGPEARAIIERFGYGVDQ